MSETTIIFLYDFEKKEFCLQFQRQTYAKAYQAQNTEARILAENPYQAWLPCTRGLVCVRSCSLGMVAMFESQSAAEKWQKQTILGYVVKLGQDSGVCFERGWNSLDLENKIGIRDDSPPIPMPIPMPMPRPTPMSRPMMMPMPEHIKVPVKEKEPVHKRRIRVEPQIHSVPFKPRLP
ncbi:hypothetical protein F4811DRAFT_535423 [Daldinia bambusicola]|nr:hypothetical protein F4811DRAFT_535423 [Daldinia bambusicola]